MNILYRVATTDDVPGMALIRANEWAKADYWEMRISGYLNGHHYPQQALDPRIIFVALDNEKVIGFIAGHLTERFGCDAELQWIDVSPEYRRKGIASQLIRALTHWFTGQGARHICVNVEPGNVIGRGFYRNNGATELSEYWMEWEDIGIAIK